MHSGKETRRAATDLTEAFARRRHGADAAAYEHGGPLRYVDGIDVYVKFQ